MSVINQVLKDLDQRDPALFSMQHLGGVVGLHPSNIAKKLDSKKIWWLTILVALCVSVGAGLQKYIPDSSRIDFINESPQSGIEVLVQEADSAKSDFSSKSVILSVVIEKAENNIDIVFLVDKLINTPVQSVNENGGVEIRLDNVSLDSHLPLLPKNNPYLKSYSINKSDDGLILDLQLKEDAVLFSSVPKKTDDKQYRWFFRIENESSEKNETRIVKLGNTPAQPINDAVIRKKPVSGKSRSMFHYERAVSYIQSGRSLVAIDALLQSLQSFPKMHQSRELLATLYFRNGRDAEAHILLQQGIDLDPAYLSFVNLYAQSLIERGQLALAQQLLLSNLRYAENDANYYVQLAGVNQRLGEHIDAVNYYMQALTWAPEHGHSWVGLAISLEALGEKEQAREAYIAASNSNGLNANLLNYINTRLEELGS